MRATRRIQVAPRWFVLVAASFVALTIGVSVGSVSAHTEIGETVPADGDVVGVPVDVVTVAFLAPVELIDNGFEVFTPQGEIVEPPVETDDDIEFRLLFDPPLAGGDVGVRYEVRAEDGHVIDGSFSFTVDAPPPTTAPSPTTTSPTTTAPAATTTSPTVTTTAPNGTSPATTSPPTTSTTDDSAVTSTSTASTVAPDALTPEGEDDDGSSTVLVVVVALAAIAAVGGLVALRGRSGSSPDAT